MTKKEKEAFDKLKKRVDDLEARPYWPTVIVQPVVPYTPPVLPAPYIGPWTHPTTTPYFEPGKPIWYYDQNNPAWTC